MRTGPHSSPFTIFASIYTVPVHIVLYGHFLRPHNAPVAGDLAGKPGKPALCGHFQTRVTCIVRTLFLKVMHARAFAAQ